MTELTNWRTWPKTTGDEPSASTGDTVAPVLRLVSSTANGHGRDLAATLRTEDAAQSEGLSPFERVTCPVHRVWAHRCISSPLHVIRMTGHRWCADCQAPANVAVDELSGRVSVSCCRCGRPPAGPATPQIVRTCQASIASAARRPRPTMAFASPQRRSA